MFNVRLLTEEDYPVLCEWWHFWRFPAPPQDCLPGNGTGGIMVMKGDVNVCAGFIYFTNSKLCWVEFVLRNYEYREKDSSEAIQFLLDELCGIAERKGFKGVFSSIKHPSLIKHYEACNFQMNEGTVEFIKVF